MAKIHRRHNKKGRQIVETKIDKSEQKKIKVEFALDSSRYDESNELVIPSAKRKTKKLKSKNAAPVKLLSKKKRKRLEKLVEQKKKKENKFEVIKALEEVQAKPKDLECIIPLQAAQTVGRKKFIVRGISCQQMETKDVEICITKGIKQKWKLAEKISKKNIVYLGEYSDAESEDTDLETEAISENFVEIPIISDKNLSNENLNNNNTTLGNNETVSNECDETINKENTLSHEGTIVKSMEYITPPITKAVFELLNRLPNVQEARLRLPILSEEQAVMEAINENPVTVIVGPTGSGKTTQVPQFLYEAGYTNNGMMVGVTEPRRVAAMSVSKRVSYEMNLSSKEVSYQIRFEGNASDKTKIKFMTDGILLKEIQLDPALKKYSAIVIDEAHERSIYSDILIGILSRIIPKRQSKGNPLKLIIMSATLRIEDFVDNERLFKGIKPPVVKIDSRMFDVTLHFNKKTNEDYLLEAYKKVCRIHRELPEGGILVFLTGQQEVNTLCRKLSNTFPGDPSVKMCISNKSDNLPPKKKRKLDQHHKEVEVILPKINLSDFLQPQTIEKSAEVLKDIADSGTLEEVDADGNLEDDEDLEDLDAFQRGPEEPLYILPLYSMLPGDRQKLIFESPPEGKRLCVVATNVAETSLTIPNIKYVVDSGKVKEKLHDPVTGVSMFHISWISQASANQRAGRAGRTAPGHCYRLYSSAVYNDEFQPYSSPDILKRPIDDLVLLMKSMRLPVVNFPFPTPPKHNQILAGLKRLITLDALEGKGENRSKSSVPIKDFTVITELGKVMAAFPLSPRYAKMLVLSSQHAMLLPYVIIIVCALTVQEILVQQPMDSKLNDLQKKWLALRLSWLGNGQKKLLGDIMILLNSILAAETQQASRNWCEVNGLRHKAITEVRKLRRQLTNEINLISPNIPVFMDPNLRPPNQQQAGLLRQIVLSGSVDHVARRVDESEINDPEEKRKWKNAYRTMDIEDPVFLMSTSPLRLAAPQWVVYQDIFETNKLFMRGVTAIEPEWLPAFAPKLCSFNPKIINEPPPRYDCNTDRILCHRAATFGPRAWELPNTEHGYPERGVEISLYAWVAYFLLSGDLCHSLQKYNKYLYEMKTIISKYAYRFKSQRDDLINALRSEQVQSLSKLKALWEKRPKYLLKEYLNWLKDDTLKDEIISIWPPLDSSTDHR